MTAGAAPGCPYDFSSDMPPGAFCVYRGAVRSADGAICSDDALVIWSSHLPTDRHNDALARLPASDVFLGFVDEPSLVFHAVATLRTRAHLSDYRLAPGQEAVPLDGLTTLGGGTVGPGALTMTLRSPLALGVDEEPCALGSYLGIFIGVIGQSRKNVSVPGPSN